MNEQCFAASALIRSSPSREADTSHGRAECPLLGKENYELTEKPTDRIAMGVSASRERELRINAEAAKCSEFTAFCRLRVNS